ncbi:MAG: DUF3617 family protein [Acidobacteriota bacterium]
MKTTTATALLSLTLVLTFAAAPLSAADRLRAGQWEITTTRPNRPTTTVTLCVGVEEATGINGDEKAGRDYVEKKSGKDCKMNEFKLNGLSASYSMTCAGTTIRASLTYHGDSYEGEMVVRPAGGPEMVSHKKARRLGACP